MKRQHDRQPPPLRLLFRLRIQIRDIVRVGPFCRLDPLPPEVGELRDLICEHFVDGFLG